MLDFAALLRRLLYREKQNYEDLKSELLGAVGQSCLRSFLLLFFATLKRSFAETGGAARLMNPKSCVKTCA